MKRYFKTCLTVLGAVILSLSLATAQTTPDRTDQDFLTSAANSNQFEIALGTQAVKQSENEDIKRYGQMLIDDHTKVLEELKEAAVAKKLEVPEAMEEREASMLKSMSQLSGAAFDRVFKEIAINTHEYAIALFEKAAHTLNDTEFRTWASQKIPSLKNHLERAKALEIETQSNTLPPQADSIETL